MRTLSSQEHGSECRPCLGSCGHLNLGFPGLGVYLRNSLGIQTLRVTPVTIMKRTVPKGLPKAPLSRPNLNGRRPQKHSPNPRREVALWRPMGTTEKGMSRVATVQVALGTQQPMDWGWPPAGGPTAPAKAPPPSRPAPGFAPYPRPAGQRTRIGVPCHCALQGDALRPGRRGSNVGAGGGGRNASSLRERGACGRTPPVDQLDSILFPRKLRDRQDTSRRAGFLPAGSERDR